MRPENALSMQIISPILTPYRSRLRDADRSGRQSSYLSPGRVDCGACHAYLSINPPPTDNRIFACGEIFVSVFVSRATRGEVSAGSGADSWRKEALRTAMAPQRTGEMNRRK